MSREKQTVIDKLKAFFERFFSIGSSYFKLEERATTTIGIQQSIVVTDELENKVFTCDFKTQQTLKAAKKPVEYG